MTAHLNPQPGTPIGLADIIALLGHRQWTSIMQKEIGATHVRNHHITPGIVPALVGALADGDIWYGVNEITTPPTGNGRATEKTVAHWCAIWADLDIKTGGCPTPDIADHIIDDLTHVYGTPPTYIVSSGHGLQPVWVIDHNDPAAHLDDNTRPTAAALLRRHGRLVQATAKSRGAKADSVFDLPRVLRAPGTTNHKTTPVATSAVYTGGRPLTVAHITAALDAAHIDELPEQTSTTYVAPSTWRHRPDGRCGYADQMIDGWAGDNPAARHPWLLAQATRIAAARRYGCLTTTDAYTAERELEQRFHTLCNRHGDARPVGGREVPAAIAYGQDLVASMSDQRLATELGGHPHDRRDPADDLDQLRALAAGSHTNPHQSSDIPPKPFQPNVTESSDPYSEPTAAETQVAGTITPDDLWADRVEHIETSFDFWQARPALDTIYRAALAAEASPWAVLGIVLLRVIAAVPHNVHLPSIGAHGKRGSLNLFAGIAAKSGGGKGLAAGVAEDLYRHSTIFAAPPGSGEGIGHLFGRMVTDKQANTTEFQWAHRTVMIDAPEVESLGAIGGRKGSTADAILRQAFSGETLGFSYASAEKRLRIPAGEYRMTMMVGVQPEVAGALFAGASGGTPQRFLWVPAEDHRLGDDTAEWDGQPITGFRPEWWHNDDGAHHHTISVCPEALDEIRDDRRRRGKRISVVARPHDDDSEIDNLDAHALYMREKVAAALAILDERNHITVDDWWLSGAVLAMSLMTRDGITEVMEAARLRDAEKRGMEKGAEQIGAKATTAELDEARLSGTRQRIVSVLTEDTDIGIPRRDILSRASKAQRPYVKTALAGLEDDGIVERVEIDTTTKGGRPGELFRLAR